MGQKEKISGFIYLMAMSDERNSKESAKNPRIIRVVLGKNRKVLANPEEHPQPKRRGRPPRDPSQPPRLKVKDLASATGIPKRRGRPPRDPNQPPRLKVKDLASATGIPKRRGRPPRDPNQPPRLKVKDLASATGIPKRRGRPPRDPSQPPRLKVKDLASATGIPKRRGRPPRDLNPSTIQRTVLPTPTPWKEECKATVTPEPVAEPPIAEVPQSNSELVLNAEQLPPQLVILPINNRPLMPGITIPLHFQGELYAKLVQEISDSPDKMFGVAYAKILREENPLHSDIHLIGTALKLVRVVTSEDGDIQVLARSLHRIERQVEVTRTPAIRWNVLYRRDIPMKPSEEIKAYTLAIISQVKELLGLSPLFQEQLKMLVSHLDFENPGLTMDLITAMTTAEPERIQDILATFDIMERGKKVLQLLREEIDLQKLQMQIKSQIDDKISAQQKEFFLREQLRVIKKELGIEKDEKAADLEALHAKLNALQLSEEARRVANEELHKLSVLEPAASEYPLIRNYLTWISDLPWQITTPDNLDLAHTMQVLDKTHFGLDEVKDRIVEFVATAQKCGNLAGTILCLVGPPGVGKTTIGRSIADALERKFFRFSVGGMRDEAEIKGHRRTYIGAMPGKLVQSLKRTGSANPVVLIDEIDKINASYQGDPAAALLEVLDPEQNKEFLDHYLDIRFDFSKILFVTTANSLDSIPAPLLDRMEIIKLSGYVLEEKLEIAKRHLLPTQLTEHGLTSKDLKISDRIWTILIDQYAREAGVRSLEGLIRKMCRKTARKQVEGQTGTLVVDEAVLRDFLGLAPFTGGELFNTGVPGVALGLAWTSMGGSTLYMEATSVEHAGGGFKTTGRLGETMQESAQIAYTIARKIYGESHPDKAEFLAKNQIHLHVPEGATPKDGPSAGITMTLALMSLFEGKAVKENLAMTGEVTLTGKVLPIGGVREKVIAAKRLKVRELILPKANQRDFDKLPEYIRKGVQVHYADWFSDVLTIALPQAVSSRRVAKSS